MYQKVLFLRSHQSFADVSFLSSYHAIRHHQLTSCGAWSLRCGSIFRRAGRSASVVITINLRRYIQLQFCQNAPSTNG